jgi:hypothetical protein
MPSLPKTRICSNTRFYLSKSLRQHLKTQRKPNRFLSNFDLGNGLTLYDMLDLHGQMSRSPNETWSESIKFYGRTFLWIAKMLHCKSVCDILIFCRRQGCQMVYYLAKIPILKTKATPRGQISPLGANFTPGYQLHPWGQSLPRYQKSVSTALIF